MATSRKLNFARREKSRQIKLAKTIESLAKKIRSGAYYCREMTSETIPPHLFEVHAASSGGPIFYSPGSQMRVLIHVEKRTARRHGKGAGE